MNQACAMKMKILLNKYHQKYLQLTKRVKDKLQYSASGKFLPNWLEIFIVGRPQAFDDSGKSPIRS